MTELPLVSIVIPCYNYGHFIHEAIACMQAQTYKNWEIIIADDGSEDETIQILKNLENSYKIQIIYLKNGGPSFARNQAIRISNGKYILPLDADDRIGEEYLELAVKLLEENDNLGIVTCEARFFGSKNEKWNLPSYSFPEILLDNSIFVTSVFRKSDWIATGGFDISFKDEWEDHDFWLKIIELGREVYRIPKELFFYRKGHTSRTSRFGLEYLPIYENLINKHSKLYSDNILFFIQKIIELRVELHEKDLKYNNLFSIKIIRYYLSIKSKILNFVRNFSS